MMAEKYAQYLVSANRIEELRFQRLEILMNEAVPIDRLEKINEEIAAERRKAFKDVEGDPKDLLPLEDLQKEVLKGMKTILAGDREQGSTMIVLCYSLRDLFHPDEPIYTPEALELLDDVRRAEMADGPQ